MRARPALLALLLALALAPPARAGAAQDWSFAPLGARHDDAVRYRLPFRLERPQMLMQGVGGGISHTGPEHYAFDFAMAEGSDVLAARDGTVARVHDGETEGGFEPRFQGTGNVVIVLHADGTFAVYAHLRKGIPVREGQAVRAGALIGHSGSTGYAIGPHLHFAVYRRLDEAAVTSIPIRFGVGSPTGFVPENGQFYGGQRRSNATLQVSAGGRVVDARNPLRLARGASVPLSVVLVGPDGRPVDATRSPATRYSAPIAWTTTVAADGTVRAAPTPDYARALERMPPEQKPAGSMDWGVVVVSHEDPAAGVVAFTSVPIVIEDGPR